MGSQKSKMIKWAIVFLVTCGLSHGEGVAKAGAGQGNYQAAADTTDLYYYQPYQQPNPYYGYSGYNVNNLYNPFNTEKQDLLGGGGDEGGIIAAVVIVGVILVIGLLILLAIPTILSIIALVAGSIGDATNPFDMLKQMLNKDNVRSVEAFRALLSDESCIERISCAIGKRTLGSRRFSLNGRNIFKKLTRDSIEKEYSSPGEDKPSLVQRISRAFKGENCQAYKCSLFSYFH